MKRLSEVRLRNAGEFFDLAPAFRKHAGEALKRWRASAGVTRERLAPAIGMSVATLTRTENGASDLRLAHVFMLERIQPGLVAALMAFKPPTQAKPRRSRNNEARA
jgi:transcriptional regulator with XRE-family HTH domain